MDGIDNSISQSHPLRSRENIYDYRDPPVKIVKSGQMSDGNSLKSPSSIGGITLTNTTKTGSQSSLRSAISMKESVNSGVTGKSQAPSNKGSTSTSSNKNLKYSQKSLNTAPESDSDRSTMKISNKNLSYNNLKNRSREYLGSGSSPEEEKPPPKMGTPVAAQRKSVKTSRTHLVEGIPQTEV